jgi:predicted ferric reductase
MKISATDFRKRTSPGAWVLAAAVIGTPLLWLLARPAGQPTGRFIGELCGVEAVLLFSCALVLATLLRPIERAFGGLDEVALWHRRLASAGVLLLFPHIALVSSPKDPFETALGHGLGDVAFAGLLILAAWALAPRLRAARWPGPIRRMARATYERWLTAHRLTGVFVALAVAHAAIVDPVLHRSTLLLVVFLMIGCTGVAAYLYRELLARYFVAIYDYAVSDVRRLNESTLEVDLSAQHDKLRFAPGQFVFLAFGGSGGWQRHPFTVSSGAQERHLRVTIKALGDYTGELGDQLRPGVPAKVAGPFGGFDYRSGGHQQIWIAGGVGITPFMSWIRSMDGSFDRDVDFYYSVGRRSEAVYLDEIEAAGARHKSFRAHLVSSDEDGLLTGARVIAEVPHGASPWVYLCGPPAMTAALSKDLHRLGLPHGQIRWEQFETR